ncbi:unnamed protein product [Sympodiomycopsis kandeliae]
MLKSNLKALLDSFGISAIQKAAQPPCLSRSQRWLHSGARCQASPQSQHTAANVPTPEFGNPEAFVSISQSPLFNLSFEEHLLRTKPPNAPVCFIYRNDPCVVIGRNQNHWKELNIDEMRVRNLALVRRRSGGGAVFHDHGNTNFSFHVPRMTFERRTHAELMARALNGPAIGLRTVVSASQPCPPASGFEHGRGSPEGVYVNDRNDLVVKISVPSVDGAGKIWSERKISGSAFKILTHRAYHHGTTLLSADLASLGSALRNQKSSKMVSKGVESVKSGVVNLADAYPDVAVRGLLSHDSFTKAVVGEFWRTYSRFGRDEEESEQHQIDGQFQEVDESHPLAQEAKRTELQAEIGKWEWIFGQCPEFEVDFEVRNASNDIKSALASEGLEDAHVWLRCKSGILEDVQLRSITVSEYPASQRKWEEVLRSLIGTKYDSLTDRPPLPASAEDPGKLETPSDKVQQGTLESSLRLWLREAL